MKTCVQTLPQVFLPVSLKAKVAIPPETVRGSVELLTSQSWDKSGGAGMFAQQ